MKAELIYWFTFELAHSIKVQIPNYQNYSNVYKHSKFKYLYLFSQNRNPSLSFNYYWAIGMRNLNLYARNSYVFTLRELFTATNSRLKIM